MADQPRRTDLATLGLPNRAAQLDALRERERMRAEAMQVLREYAAGIWGDYTHLAGAGIEEREVLFEIADAIENGDQTAVHLRKVADLCPDGLGHWREYCDIREGACRTSAMREL